MRNEATSTQCLQLLCLLLTFPFLYTTAAAQDDKQLVRLAVIEVDTTQLDRYNDFLKEEIAASIEKEPGVLTLYAVAEKAHPSHVTLFETYADSSQYRAHLSTPHFQKYKQGTLQIVRHLDLIATRPILYVRKAALTTARTQDFFIRLIKMTIDSSQLDNFNTLAQRVMKPGIKEESGVLVMFAVAEQKSPTNIHILEVYANKAAYDTHIKTPHFIEYKNASQNMVTSLTLIDVRPILLGSKTQQ